jgi:hypothetical protein
LLKKQIQILYIRDSSSTPYTYMRYKAVNKGDEDKISQALQKLMMEEPYTESSPMTVRMARHSSMEWETSIWKLQSANF